MYKNGCIVYYAYIHKSDLSILYLYFFSQPYQDKAYKEFEWYLFVEIIIISIF